MEYDGKNKSPYHGFILSCLVLILVPCLLFLFVYSIVSKYSNLSKELNVYTAMGFGFCAGTLFHISCIIAGLFKGNFGVVIRRIGDFISNLFISKKLAFKLYKEDIIENGIVFWPYLFIILSCLGLSIYGFVNFFTSY